MTVCTDQYSTIECSAYCGRALPKAGRSVAKGPVRNELRGAQCPKWLSQKAVGCASRKYFVWLVITIGFE